MADAVDLFVCGAHKVDALFMSAGFSRQRSNNRYFFGKTGKPLQVLAEKNAGCASLDRSGFTLRLAARLRVKRIEMAHGSLHEEIDNVFGLA